MYNKRGLSRRGQVTVFVIIAIVLVAGVALFFVFRDNLFDEDIPVEMQPVYNNFLDCVRENTFVGIDVMESQGGYIKVPEFEPGSRHSPFGSQLNFLGNAVPYWYYVSGNGVEKQQVPTKNEMQEQLADFVEDQIYDCGFDEFYEQGFVVRLGQDPEARAIIEDNKVSVAVDFDLAIEKTNDSVVVDKHEISVDSELGSLYDAARDVYAYEQENLFLEEYAVDNLRMYAPVDGVELSCSPSVWNAEEVFDDLENAIETNTIYLRSDSSDFDLVNKDNEYYVVDLPVDYGVKFLNSKQWPKMFEVNPSEGPALIAEPSGANNPGLGVLGFCYVPYHFVYDIKYPVMIQIFSDDSPDAEIFQFPMAVVLEGNVPRQAYNTTALNSEILDFCEYKNTPIGLNVYDMNSNPVDARISYRCAGTICDIGETSSGYLGEDFPQCGGGTLIVDAEGYEDFSTELSIVEEETYDVYLEKLYDLDIDLSLGNRDYNGDAIITFSKEDGDVRSVIYPQQKSVSLSEGQYEIRVSVYENSSINLAATSTEQCVEVPRSGLGGLLGLTDEECYDIDIPAQVISNVLAGGGIQNYYVLESELRDSTKININADKLPVPRELEDLQMNYILFEDKGLEVEFE